MMKFRSNGWSDEDMRTLRSMAIAGATVREIHEAMPHKSMSAVSHRASAEGIALRPSSNIPAGNFHRVPATHSAAWMGCRVSVGADTADEARRLCEAVVASAAEFRAKRMGRAA